jgi:TolA-binding protein
MLAVGAHAEGSRWDSLRTYFKHLKQGLMESSVAGSYQKRSSVAVAAVRGSGQADDKADLGQPAMKDPARERKIKARKAETREFEKAADLAVAGKFEEAGAALEAFEKAHPKSTLLADVKEAKGKVKEAIEAQKAEPAPAEPAKPGQ